MTPRCLICDKAYPTISSVEAYAGRVLMRPHSNVDAWLCNAPKCLQAWIDSFRVMHHLGGKP